MCKVAGITKITDRTREDIWLFMMSLGDVISQYNTDGLGYAAFDKQGKLFGERWLYNKTAFTDLSKTIRRLTPENIHTVYNFFGDKVLRDQAQAITLHTRMATCERGIKNAHPFVNDKDEPKTSIIHNGMIGNHELLTKKYSTCDSEVIVHLYEDKKVSENLENIKSVMNSLSGWFTVLALTTQPDGRLVMDIFSDSGRLSSFFIPELDARVYSTSAQDIIQIANMFGMAYKDHQQLKADSAQRIDVLTGEVLQTIQFEKKYSYKDNVSIAEGNFDDDDFFHNFFGRHKNAR